MDRRILFCTLLTCLFVSKLHAQFGNLLKGGIGEATKIMGVDKYLRQAAPISTTFNDVVRAGEMLPDFKANENFQPLYLLPKNQDGGYQLCEGFYEMTNLSYCLMAGTYAPSKGDGYMFAPVLGSKEAIVISIIKNAEKHPEINQNDIQMLLWAIVARSSFSSMSPQFRKIAKTLLTPQQVSALDHDAMSVLPLDMIDRVKSQMPEGVRLVFEAENNIRNLVSRDDYNYTDMERYAILTGMASPRADVPAGIWTKHPDGYYIRYFPQGYQQTKVQIYVPKEAIVNGKTLIYDANGDIACPANYGSQRLAQTNIPIKPNYKQKLINPCTSK